MYYAIDRATNIVPVFEEMDYKFPEKFPFAEIGFITKYLTVKHERHLQY